MSDAGNNRAYTFAERLESHQNSTTRSIYHAAVGKFLKSIYQTEQKVETLASRYIKEVGKRDYRRDSLAQSSQLIHFFGGRKWVMLSPSTITSASTNIWSSCFAGSPSTPCTTTGFINTHFSPACYPTTCTVTTFFFHYAAGDQGLIINEWQNASSDRGGNRGDIRSSNT